MTDQIVLLGNYHDIPVSVALGDNQTGFLGAAGLEKETWLVNVGTGSQISVLSETCFEKELRRHLGRRYEGVLSSSRIV